MPLFQTKINELSIGFEKAINYRKLNSVNADLDAITLEDAQAIQTPLVNLLKEVAAINTDPELSAKGKEARIAKAQQVAIDKISKIDKRPTLEKGVETLEAHSINDVAQERMKNQPKDTNLDYLQTSEMRSYLRQFRESEKAKHEAMIQAHEDEGTFLPDQMKHFSDPVERLFLQACKTYDETKEQLIRAVTEAPFPIEMLPQEIIEKGKVALQQSIAPERVENLESARVRQSMFNELMSSAVEIIQAPLKHAVVEEAPLLMPDNPLPAEQQEASA